MFSPRWYQDEACKAVWSALCDQPDSNPVIVLPTGAGKSWVIAELSRSAVVDYGGRVLVLAHRKELLQQNAEKIASLLPFPRRCSLYSAGLNKRDLEGDVVVAGIQSIFKRAHELGNINLILIDEAHLVPKDGEGMYLQFLANLRQYCPRLRVVGLTATAYRTDSGSILGRDSIFQSICYEAPIQRLMAEGFLCKLTNKPSRQIYDTSTLHLRGGEFIANEVESLFGVEKDAKQSAREIVEQTQDRKSILVFCSGVKHAEMICNYLQELVYEDGDNDLIGIVTGETLPIERQQILDDFKIGKIRYLVNVDVLTTGFDATCIDAIVILRATMSPGLFVQMCGRGLRTHPGKSDCLILDFGENLKRHGPIDAIDFNKKKAQKQLEKGDGQGPGKQCPGCQSMVAANTRVCECGFIFPVNTYQADTESQLLVAPQKWEVIESKASLHKKKNAEEGSPPTLRIDYICQRWGEEFGNLSEQQISEWICLEHDGFAGRKADHWWHTHSRAERPLTVMEGLQLWLAGAVACPTSITTIREGRFDKILSREIDEVPERWRGSEMTKKEFDQIWDGPSLTCVNAFSGNEEEPPF